MKLLSFLFLLFAISDLFGSNDFELKLTFNGPHNDTLWFGQSHAKKALPEFFVLGNSSGEYVISSTNKHPNGIYAIIYKGFHETKMNFFNVILSDTERNYSIKCNSQDIYKSLQFTGAPENSALLEYRNSMYDLNKNFTVYSERYRVVEDESSFADVVKLEDSLNSLQTSIQAKFPNSVLSTFIELTRINPPSRTDDFKKSKEKRNGYYKNDFLKKFDAHNAMFWSNPMAVDWLDIYTFRICNNYDDELSAVKNLIGKLESDDAAFRYYVNYMLNSFDRMTQFNFDNVYTYLVDKYVKTGKTTWLSEDEVSKCYEKSDNIVRLSEGQQAEDVTLFLEDNKTVTLSDIDSKYTMLFFWNPDCSHCKKEIPLLKNKNDILKKIGVKVAAMCVQSNTMISKCWNYVHQNDLPDNWLFLSDGNNESKYRTKFNVTSYPMMYILDKDKKIVFKRKGEMEDFELEKLFQSL